MKPIRVIAVVAAFAAASLAVSPATAAPAADVNWPQFRFNQNHTGVNPFETVLNAQNVPTLQDLDPDLWMPRIACPSRDVVEEVQLVDQIRRQVGRILRTLSPEDYQRKGNHTVAGPAVEAGAYSFRSVGPRAHSVVADFSCPARSRHAGNAAQPDPRQRRRL